MLMLPLIWSDTLWRSGFAGSFPSMLGYVASGVYLFRAGRLLFGSRSAAWVAALIFLLNPNILYLQSTAMTELVQLAAEAAALYYTLRWAYHGRAFDLVLAAGAVAAGSLVRYDAWALAISITVIVGFVAWRTLGRGGAEASLIVFGTLAFAGCAAWVIYNWVIYHDPLYFLTGPYSAQGQQQFIEAHQGAGALPTHHDVLLSLRVYGASVIDSAGWPLAALGVLGLVAWVLRRQVQVAALPLYAALTPFAFNCLSLFLGISTMWTPDVSINGVSNYFNVRYGVMMLPAVALFVALWSARSRALLLIVLGVALVFSGFNPALGTPYVLAEPLHGVLSQGHDLAHQEGAFLAAHYHGGGILFNAGDMQSAIFFSDLPYNDFITAADNRDFPAAIAHPEAYATWIIMDPYAGNYDPVYAGLNARQDWRPHYKLAAVIGTAQIYELMGSN
jgi:4-amino-4-deoxy-L-arabinose transferase-like glycosyltransferase